LCTPLRVASLHIYSHQDKAVTADQSQALAHMFEASRRQVLVHDLGQ
jgi:hypothetical protein